VLTTFFNDYKIGTDKIIFRDKIKIKKDETAGELHDKLKQEGAKLVLKTIKAIINKNYPQVNQSRLIRKNTILKTAPKINKENCIIKWDNTYKDIHNMVRGLCPVPCARTTVTSPAGKSFILKIYQTEKIIKKHTLQYGTIVTDNKTYIKIAANKGFVNILSLQMEGKKRMQTDEFLRGVKNFDKYVIG